MNNEEKPKPYKYTDDIVCLIIVVAYVLGKVFGWEIPDWCLASALGYAFGKTMPQQKGG